MSADGPEELSAHSEEERVARFIDEFDAEEVTEGSGVVPQVAPDGEQSPENERGEQAVTSNERGA